MKTAVLLKHLGKKKIKLFDTESVEEKNVIKSTMEIYFMILG